MFVPQLRQPLSQAEDLFYSKYDGAAERRRRPWRGRTKLLSKTSLSLFWFSMFDGLMEVFFILLIGVGADNAPQNAGSQNLPYRNFLKVCASNDENLRDE